MTEDVDGDQPMTQNVDGHEQATEDVDGDQPVTQNVDGEQHATEDMYVDQNSSQSDIDEVIKFSCHS